MNTQNKSSGGIPWFPGVWIAAVVVALVGGRMVWVSANRPAHRQEITDAFGSVSLFYGGIEMNHDGSKFTYVATSDIGYGLFFYDSAIGRKQNICDEHGVGSLGGSSDIKACPWSPDDSAFIYTFHDKLVIHSSDNSTAPTELLIGTNGVSDLVWLNAGEFAYVSYGTNLCYVQKQSDGQWQQHKLLHGDGIVSLTAFDTNTVAWLQDGLICRLDLTVGLTGISNLVAASVPDTGIMPPTNGLKLWLDASTLHQADQTAVSFLSDLSASANDAVPNGTPPTFNGSESTRALNGKGTIHFTSADSVANATGLKTRAKLGIAGSAPRTVFTVMHHDVGGSMRISLGDFGARFGYFGLEEDDRSLYLPRVWNRWADRVIMRSPTWNISEVIYDQIRHSAYVNGVLKSTNSIRVETMDKEVEIGLRSASSGATNAVGADGDFAELMIYSRALDVGERQRVESYLKTKWLGNNLLSAESPLVWCNPEMAGLTSFSYSKETGQFLLNKSENGKNSLWLYNPSATNSDNLPKIAEAGSIKNAQWIGKKGCAYASLDPGHGCVVLADSLGAEKNRLFEREDIKWFQATPDGGKLLIVGTFSNAPAMGIWRYDLGSGQLRSLVPGSDHPSVYAKNIIPLRGSIKLPSGRNADCTIFPPANLDRHKKYPLVIGYTVLHTIVNGSDGRLWVADLATCGAYVVIVDRASWDGGIQNWGENVMGAYKTLEQNPNVDTSRVYLVGASLETVYMSQFVSNSPDLWKGVILLNPSGLPDFSNSPRFRQMPKILISAGGEEHEGDRLKKYQEDCLKSGVIVDYVIHPGESHHLVGNAGQFERTRAMMHFIFEE